MPQVVCLYTFTAQLSADRLSYRDLSSPPDIALQLVSDYNLLGAHTQTTRWSNTQAHIVHMSEHTSKIFDLIKTGFPFKLKATLN